MKRLPIRQKTECARLDKQKKRGRKEELRPGRKAKKKKRQGSSKLILCQSSQNFQFPELHGQSGRAE